MKQNKTKKIFLGFSLILFLVVISAGVLYSAPKEKKTAAPTAKKSAVKGWDCAGCHKDKKVLSANHVNLKDMPYDGCLVCHIPGEGNAGSLRTKIPGSHLHALKGIQCDQCHGKVKKPAPVEMSKCIACHGETAKLAEKTAKIKPRNPHESPHYGTEADCNLCHHQHAKSENLCAQCHSYNFVVP